MFQCRYEWGILSDVSIIRMNKRVFPAPRSPLRDRFIRVHPHWRRLAFGYSGAPLTGYSGESITGYSGAPITGYGGAPLTGYGGAPITGFSGESITSYSGSPTTGYSRASLTGYTINWLHRCQSTIHSLQWTTINRLQRTTNMPMQCNTDITSVMMMIRNEFACKQHWNLSNSDFLAEIV